MKKIIYLSLILLLAACGGNKNEQNNIADNTDHNQEINSNDTVKADISTGATSKPNQVSFNGVIEMPPQKRVTVALTMGGVVKSTSLLPGQFVNKGTVIATIDNPEFIALQQTFLESSAQTEYLETEYKRQKALSDEQAASQKKLQQSKAEYLSMKSKMEASATQLNLLGVQTQSLLTSGIQPLLQVKAPISGYIGDVEMNVGKYMNAGDALCEIIDKSNPMLKLTAYEKDLADIKPGSHVEFRVNGMGNTVYGATLFSIGQKVDELSRSVKIYCKVDKPDNNFRPGMYITARIKKEK